MGREGRCLCLTEPSSPPSTPRGLREGREYCVCVLRRGEDAVPVLVVRSKNTPEDRRVSSHFSPSLAPFLCSSPWLGRVATPTRDESALHDSFH